MENNDKMSLSSFILSVLKTYGINNADIVTDFIGLIDKFGDGVLEDTEVYITSDDQILSTIMYYNDMVMGRTRPATTTRRVAGVASHSSDLLNMGKAEFTEYAGDLMDLLTKRVKAGDSQSSTKYKEMLRNMLSGMNDDEFVKAPSLKKSLIAVAINYLIEAGFQNAEDAFNYIKQHGFRFTHTDPETAATTDAPKTPTQRKTQVRIEEGTLYMPESLHGTKFRLSTVLTAISQNAPMSDESRRKVKTLVERFRYMDTNEEARNVCCIDELRIISPSSMKKDPKHALCDILFAVRNQRAMASSAAIIGWLLEITTEIAKQNVERLRGFYGEELDYTIESAQELSNDTFGAAFDGDPGLFEAITSDLISVMFACCPSMDNVMFDIITEKRHCKD